LARGNSGCACEHKIKSTFFGSRLVSRAFSWQEFIRTASNHGISSSFDT
jgi:hypothetical protein